MGKNKNKKFKTDVEYRVYRLKRFGNIYGWRLTAEDRETLEFESVHNWGFITDSKVVMKIKYLIPAIETSLHHPKKGNTTLMREGEFSMKLIENVFRNPRTHMPDIIKSQYVQNKC